MDAIHEHTVSDARAHVATLVQRRGIPHVRTGQNTLAEVITRLADDEVIPDATEDTLVVLARAKGFDGAMMVSLICRYLNATARGALTRFGELRTGDIPVEEGAVAQPIL